MPVIQSETRLSLCGVYYKLQWGKQTRLSSLQANGGDQTGKIILPRKLKVACQQTFCKGLDIEF